ncbi:MAG: NUDIX domain-containing protein [Clostridia bacterium]|nr:NUDIX domain-containing protein [Clostridia bacterium]
MKKLNVVFVFDNDFENVLMCKRKKEPFKDKYNLVGGKLEDNESELDGAYRELFEETGISKEDITIKRFMDFNYYVEDMELQVFVGKLEKSVELVEELNELSWQTLNQDFFDTNKFAGEGNIGHMLRIIQNDKNMLFNK